MPTITLTKLAEIVVNRPAPKPDGKNLWIDIDINMSKLTVLIHSREEESVGTHKQRSVTFRADHECLLKFNNSAVFNLASVPLIKNKQTVLQVADDATTVDTFYEVYAGTEIGSAAKSLRQTPSVLGGPHIVVP